jgi:hypothetical protein
MLVVIVPHYLLQLMMKKQQKILQPLLRHLLRLQHKLLLQPLLRHLLRLQHKLLQLLCHHREVTILTVLKFLLTVARAILIYTMEPGISPA